MADNPADRIKPFRVANQAPKWEPGQSGNPRGRPRNDRLMTQLLGAKLEELNVRTHKKRIEQCIETLVNKANRGNMEAIKLVFAYMDGRPVQPTTLDANINAGTPEERREILLSKLKELQGEKK